MKKYILFVVLICLLLISSCKEKHECNFMYKGIENATCVEDGTISYYCECGLEKYEKIPAEGHNMVDATCQSPKKCTKCNYKEGTTVSCKFINEKCIYCNSVLPKSIYCPFTKYDVEVGETLEIIYEVQPTNAVNKQVKITSSDSSILKVENNDTLIAVSEGKVPVFIL